MIYIKTIKNSSFRTEGIISFLKFIIIFFGVGGWGSAQSRILVLSSPCFLPFAIQFVLCVFLLFFVDLLFFPLLFVFLSFIYLEIFKSKLHVDRSNVLRGTYLKSLFAIWYLIFISKMKKLNTLHS